MKVLYKAALVLLALLVALSIAGCGGAPTATPAAPTAITVPGATEQASPALTGTPVAATTAAATPNSGATYPNYGRAADYSWVAGQLKQDGSCWIITYVSPLVQVAADQYSNRFALLPGAGWQPAGVKDGEWVVVQGQPEPGTAPAASCTAHGYSVSALQPNPNATGPSSGVGSGTGSGSGKGGSGLDIQITQFSVASNFEIRGQLNATNNGTSNIQELIPTHIQVKRATGEVVFDASAPSIQGGVLDTRPMAGLPPGMSRPYGFSAAPGNITGQVTQGDEVTGILTLSADGQVMKVLLPATKVTAVRIP
jgi:hypothetical protein